MANKKEEARKTTFTRVVHEHEPETPVAEETTPTAVEPAPVYAVGAGATVEERKKMFARQEHDRKELKKKGG